MASRLPYALTFPCEPGVTDIAAALLAASIRRGAAAPLELVAIVPMQEGGPVSIAPDLADIFAALDARLERMQPAADIATRIGLLSACLDTPVDAPTRILIETPALCLGPFAEDQALNRSFCARLSDSVDTARLHDPKQYGFQRAAGSGDDESIDPASLPYGLDTGFMVIDAQVGLGAAWRACARAAPAGGERNPDFSGRALAAAAVRAGLPLCPLDSRYGFPAHRRPLATFGDEVRFCRYDRPGVIAAEPLLLRTLAEVLQRWPALAKVLQQDAQWEPLAALIHRGFPGIRRRIGVRVSKAWAGQVPARHTGGWRHSSPRLAGVDCIVTGIPRSGTSLLCNRLHCIRDSVAINEPAEVFEALSGDNPWAMACYYRDLRLQVLEGRPLLNKMRGGEPTEDTLDKHRRDVYRPRVYRQDFTLFTKNTLAYLMRIGHLRRAMPEAPIVACIRHPADTIASWKRSFPHLRDGRVEDIPVGNPDDPWLTLEQQRRLRHISTIEAPALRRALWWRLLALTILDNRDRIELLRYEDWAPDSARSLPPLMRRIAPGLPFRTERPLEKADLRMRRDELEEADREALRVVCFNIAAEFGYRL